MEGHKSACSASALALMCRFKGCTLSTKGQGRHLGRSLPRSKYLSRIPAGWMQIWQGGRCCDVPRMGKLRTKQGWRKRKVPYSTVCWRRRVGQPMAYLLPHFSAKRPSVSSPSRPKSTLSPQEFCRLHPEPEPESVLCRSYCVLKWFKVCNFKNKIKPKSISVQSSVFLCSWSSTTEQHWRDIMRRPLWLGIFVRKRHIDRMSVYVKNDQNRPRTIISLIFRCDSQEFFFPLCAKESN